MASRDVDSLTAPLVRPRLGGPGVVLLLVSGCHAVIHAYATLLPWIYPLALVDLRFSVTALGFMVGATNLVGGFLQLGAGALTRAIRRHALLGWGVVLLGASGIATAVAANFAQFSGANLAARIVTSTQHPLGNSLLADLYSRARRGTAIAGHIAGGNVGTVLLTPAAAFVVAAWGWRNALLLLTIPAVIAGVAILIAIDERPGPTAHRSAVGDMAAGLRHVMRSRNLILIFVSSLIGAGGRGLGVVILVVPLYLKRQLHVPEPYATELYALLLIGSVLGPLTAGRVSDWLGRRRTVIIAGYGLSAVFTLALLVAPAQGPWLGVILGAMGLTVYAESPLLQAFLADEAPRTERDALFSLYFAVAFGIGSLWAVGIAAALEHLGYVPVFAIMAATYVFAAVGVWATSEGAMNSPVRR